MTKEYVQMVGRMAYVWGYAMVNSHNRRAGFKFVTSQNGNVPGWNGGVIPMAPGGGFFLSGGCEIPNDMPHENMRAMLRAAEEYGTYPIRRE